MLYIIIIAIILVLLPSLKEEQKEQIEYIRSLSPGSITYNEFIENKSQIRMNYSVPGVYVIKNSSKRGKAYVGQSVDLYRRVHSHMTGSGNGDVYHDLKSGDLFTIEFIRLSDTEFRTLNALERNRIKANNSFHSGYNKTRGNS